MKTITLTQPWASLVALAERYPDLGKHIETRSWSTSYRGPLLIHAAAGLGPVGGKRGLLDLIATEPFWSVLREAYAVQLGDERHYPGDAETIANELPYGAIVAVARLWDVIPTENFTSGVRPTARERAFGDYAPGRFAWLLADIRALPEPIPAKGALGLWEYDGELPL